MYGLSIDTVVALGYLLAFVIVLLGCSLDSWRRQRRGERMRERQGKGTQHETVDV